MEKTQGKKFKAAFALILILIFCSLFCVTSGAEEPESIHNDSTDTTPESTVSDTAEATDAEENLFSLLWDGISEYATEIFCALTFIASLFLSYTYKKGLLPTVSGAVGSISTAVSKIKESTDLESEKNDAMSRSFSVFLTKTEEAFKKTEDKLENINSRLKVLDNSADMNACFKTVLEGQVELLYDVFMSSSLPQYKKDEIGERVAKMKEALKKNGNGQTD